MGNRYEPVALDFKTWVAAGARCPLRRCHSVLGLGFCGSWLGRLSQVIRATLVKMKTFNYPVPIGDHKRILAFARQVFIIRKQEDGLTFSLGQDVMPVLPFGCASCE